MAVRKQRPAPRPAGATAIHLRGIRAHLSDPIPDDYVLPSGHPAPNIYVDLPTIKTSADAAAVTRAYVLDVFGPPPHSRTLHAQGLEHKAYRAICRAAGIPDARTRILAELEISA